MTLLTKKTLKTKTDGPVGLTLYFEGTKFIAKLVKRGDCRRYRQVGDIIEGAFNAVFGSVDHVSGSTAWSKKVVTADEADEVAKRLRLCDEVLSIVYSPAAISKKKARPSKSPDSDAIEALKQLVLGGEGIGGSLNDDIKQCEDGIAQYEERLKGRRAELEQLVSRRNRILETVKRLGG